MQGSKSPDDISLSNCNNCTVDISQDNNYKYTTRADFHKNSTCTHDIVNIFDGSNNTVKAGKGFFYCQFMNDKAELATMKSLRFSSLPLFAHAEFDE